MPDPAEHWERTYAEGASSDKSWYQRKPTMSLELIAAHAPLPTASVIDVGAGASYLVDRLLDRGTTDVTVLDVSTHALDEVRLRLGERADQVTFLTQDVLTWEPDRIYDVWHDRAVFHFLTTSDEQDRYVATANRAVRPGGCVVLATFAADGPEQCSGLPVSRYDADDLSERFAGSFARVASSREEHVTPSGAVQPFTWVVLRRTAGS